MLCAVPNCNLIGSKRCPNDEEILTILTHRFGFVKKCVKSLLTGVVIFATLLLLCFLFSLLILLAPVLDEHIVILRNYQHIKFLPSVKLPSPDPGPLEKWERTKGRREEGECGAERGMRRGKEGSGEKRMG